MEERSETGDHPSGLSELQTAILRRYAEGASSAQVARALSISEATMRRNLQEARDILGAASTANAIYLAAKGGLI
jgi:DNA-binding NarL/FixJ family response regulator